MSFEVPGYKIKTTNEDGSILLEPIDYKKIIAEFWDGHNILNSEKAIKFLSVEKNIEKIDFNKLVRHNRWPDLFFDIIMNNKKSLEFATLYYLLDFPKFRFSIAKWILETGKLLTPCILVAKKLASVDDLESIKLFAKYLDVNNIIKDAVVYEAKLILQWIIDEKLYIRLEKIHLAKAVCESVNAQKETQDLVRQILNLVIPNSANQAMIFRELLIDNSSWDRQIAEAISIYNMKY